MTDVLSLGPVLDLIERWQEDIRQWESLGLPELERQMLTIDVPALRALAEQHAAQLRKLSFMNRNSGDDVNPEPPMVSWDELNEIADAFDAAADFLCAPRRSQRGSRWRN